MLSTIFFSKKIQSSYFVKGKRIIINWLWMNTKNNLLLSSSLLAAAFFQDQQPLLHLQNNQAISNSFFFCIKYTKFTFTRLTILFNTFCSFINKKINIYNWNSPKAKVCCFFNLMIAYAFCLLCFSNININSNFK